MTKFNDIWEIAIDAHGLITSAEARALGISNHELVEYARRGKLERVGHGVYRLVRRVPEDADSYALAVKMAGPGAYLYGESVMALLGLVPTDPSRVFVATPRRVRRSLPRGVRVVRVPGGEPGTVYDGIPSQKVALAIRSAESVVGRTRLLEAAREGRRLGYVRCGELEALEEEYGYGKET